MLNSYYSTVNPLVDETRWLDTGLLAFNVVCGRGVMRGGILQLSGLSQSRKSSAALVMLRAAQKSGYITAYFDTENGFLEHVSLTLGIAKEMPKFSLEVEKDPISYKNSKKLTALSSGFLYTNTAHLIEDTLSECDRLCEVCTRSGYAPFIVIDSMSRLSTSLEEFQGYNREAPMTHARQLRKGLRLLIPALERCGGVLVLVDHKKPTGDAGFGSATGFIAHTQLEMQLENEITDMNGLPIGFKSNVIAQKSRYAPKITAPFTFYYKSGVDYAADVFWAGLHLGFLKLAGSWYKLPDSFPGEKKGCQGQAEWSAFYREYVVPNKEWLDLQVDACYIAKWRNWCIAGQIDPNEHLLLFGKDLYDRVKKREGEIKRSGIVLEEAQTAEEVEAELDAIMALDRKKKKKKEGSPNPFNL